MIVPVEVGGEQAAGDRLDDVAVHHLEVGQVLALLLQLALGAGDVVGQVVGEQGHGVEAEAVDGEVVAQAPARDHLLRGRPAGCSQPK